MSSPSVQRQVGEMLHKAGLTLAVAESCTGGLICDRLTDVSGSSDYLEMGVVAYSNRTKITLLGVPEAVIVEHGAVSEACVRAMARGIRDLAGTDLGLSVSGIAGPTGGTPDKPVGTVHMALSGTDLEDWQLFAFQGDRRQVKEQSVLEALSMVRAYCQRGHNR